MNIPITIRRVLGSIILTILWICGFLFVPSTLIIDWLDNGSFTMSLKLLVVLIGLLAIVIYHIIYHVLYPANDEVTKLSLTAAFTVAWLSLMIFYPFKEPANDAGGAVGFFALVAGLIVCVLWVRFFSDEIVAS